MGYTYKHVEALLEGKSVEFRPTGNSMSGRIESGQLVKVDPITAETPLKPGDVVLAKVHGRLFLHLIVRIDDAGRFLIGNNHGHHNGWTKRASVFGKFRPASL